MRINKPELWMLTTLFAIAGLVLVFGRVADEVSEGETAKFDQSILLFFRNANDPTNPIGPPWFEAVARDITALGSYAVLGIVVGATLIYLLMAHQRGAAFWIFAAVGGGVLLSNALKLVYERPRPELALHAARVFTSSFPSGHAALSAITYLTLGTLLASLHRERGFKFYFLTLAILLTIAVGISRVYLGVHYPTDVLAGWCMGAAWAAFCWTIFNWLQSHDRIEPSCR